MQCIVNNMEIKIEAEGSKSCKIITFSNDDLDNSNFIDLYIDDKNYCISLSDLEAVVKAFKSLKYYDPSL